MDGTDGNGKVKTEIGKLRTQRTLNTLNTLNTLITQITLNTPITPITPLTAHPLTFNLSVFRFPFKLCR